MRFSFSSLFYCLSVQIILAKTIFVSPDGNDLNNGTFEKPYFNLQNAINNSQPGDTILMRGGVYFYNATITIGSSKSGNQLNKIYLWSYPNEKPILNFKNQPYASSNRAILLTGDFWHIKGLEICYAGDNGIKIEGSNNIIEQCILHHNGDSGIQIGFAHETSNPGGLKGAYNQIVNCDSYMNFDFDSKGGDADGFACKMHNGKGNIFKGCRAWKNSDDGWDLYETDWPVEIINCWTWHNGDKTLFEAIYLAKMGTKMSSFSGNGNGFKLGGNGTGGNSKGTHVVKNCVAFNNSFASKKGFDQNSHKGGVIIHNCLSFGNGYNYMFEDNPDNGAVNEFINNVSFGHKAAMAYEFSTAAILKNNSWNLPVTANTSDFQSLDTSLALAPRQPDGSLPENAFARLVSGSDLIDKGFNLGLPFYGEAPDLGAFEYFDKALTYFTLSVLVMGNGSVSNVSGKYADGTTIKLNALANDGWKFNGWNNDTTHQTNPLFITIHSDTVITATFSEIKKDTLALKIEEKISSFLVECYPNPAKNVLTLKFNLPKKAEIAVSLISVTGATVISWNVGIYRAGNYEENYDLSAISPGLYFLEIKTGEERIIKKMVIKN